MTKRDSGSVSSGRFLWTGMLQHGAFLNQAWFWKHQLEGSSVSWNSEFNAFWQNLVLEASALVVFCELECCKILCFWTTCDSGSASSGRLLWGGMLNMVLLSQTSALARHSLLEIPVWSSIDFFVRSARCPKLPCAAPCAGLVRRFRGHSLKKRAREGSRSPF